jgi:hypothetical protein
VTTPREKAMRELGPGMEAQPSAQTALAVATAGVGYAILDLADAIRAHTEAIRPPRVEDFG